MKEKILKIMMATDWSMNSKYDPHDAADDIMKLLASEVDRVIEERMPNVVDASDQMIGLMVTASKGQINTLEALTSYDRWFRNRIKGKQ